MLYHDLKTYLRANREPLEAFRTDCGEVGVREQEGSRWRRFWGLECDVTVVPHGESWDIAWVGTSKRTKAIVSVLEAFLEERGLLLPHATLESVRGRRESDKTVPVRACNKTIDVWEQLEAARRAGVSVVSMHEEGPTYYLSRLLPLFEQYDVPSPTYEWIGGAGVAAIRGREFWAADVTSFDPRKHRTYLRAGTWLRSCYTLHRFEECLQQLAKVGEEGAWVVRGFRIG